MAVHFVFCVHNHQPVGNFGFVFEEAYQKAYRPFFEVAARYPSLRLAAHFSGVLLRWFEEHHPDFLDLLASQAADGRIEFLAGGFYEPILAVIPEHDRQGQLLKMREFINRRFGQAAEGMWLTERVWEPTMPSTVVGAGIKYVLVDDFHLRAAGITASEITRPYTTADGDSVMRVIGGSERLRYLVPFEDPEKTLAFLRGIHERHPESDQLVTLADDGEKFGVWPGTHQVAYREGWLDRFFALLLENGDWLKTTTYREALAKVAPAETVYMPTVSYMELGEWALPPEACAKFEAAREILADQPELGYTSHLVRGGYWRNFLGKYPESRYLLGRMTYISRLLRRVEGDGLEAGDEGRALLLEARDELWQAQCNDAYWHGVFGGLYLPFLRSAVSSHLARAETLVERATLGDQDFVLVDEADLDANGSDEIILRNRLLSLTVDPSSGSAFELSYKPAAINLFNALTRREEFYHRRIRPAAEEKGAEVRSIHQQSRFKDGHEPALLHYDAFQRRSMVDHLWRGDYTFEEWARGVDSWRREADAYRGHTWGAREDEVVLSMPARPRQPAWPSWEKRVTLDRVGARVGLSLRFAGRPEGSGFCAGQEFNLTPTSVMECGIDVGQASGRVEAAPRGEARFDEVVKLTVTDAYAALRIEFDFPAPLNLWIFPLFSVSNSEAGYERIYQQVALLLWRRFTGSGENESLDMALRVLPIAAES